MKKVVTGAAIVASLFILAGCGNTSKKESLSSKSSSSSTTFSGTKNEKSAEMDVDSLFDNSKHTILLSGTTQQNVSTIKAEVAALKSGSIKTKLLADIETAEKLAEKAYKESLSSSAKSESIYVKNAPERRSESIADAKESSESQSKENSRSESLDALEKSYNEDSKEEASSEKTAKSQNNAAKYENKIMELGVPTHATDVSYSGHTVTWTGFDAWKDYTHPELENLIAFLETITYQQSPKLVVKLSDGTQIAHEDPGQGLVLEN
ncbi:hypothetical protein EFP00_11075 [Lactiplantibacillus paraplantarum]|uniref:toxin Cry1Ac domain D-VI-related protein n=1 Tax=Lactiplantibacillus paraplantarum TaxID=60520 RepID=UPI0021A63598|nr:toxin Cry1Ac domain D-VI-related protein [Lactiplantibacillus paraplantarum]MCT4457940.1 hypothetical protein [Lactiplantibacillus paraplantarum]